jgi:hypothetical protein
MTHLQIVKKSYSKMNKNLDKNTECYQKCRSTRPFILKVLRFFNDIEKEIAWSRFIQVLYVKTVNDFLPVLNEEINRYKMANTMWSGPKTKHILNYLYKFKNNLLNIKKKCEDSTIVYYNYLPGNKLPIELRTKIISFISPVPIKKY